MNRLVNKKFALNTIAQVALVSALSISANTAFAQTAEKPAAAPAEQAAASTIKIGFVNTEKLLRESVPAKEAEAKIEEEFKKRDADLQKLANTLRTKYEEFDKNAPVMSDADRTKAQRD